MKIFLILIPCALCLLASPCLSQASLREAFPSGATNPVVEGWIVTLANTDWVSSDPAIAAIRERYSAQDEASIQRAIASEVSGREIRALQGLMDSDLPEVEKVAGLDILLSHKSENIAALAARVVVQRDAFSLSEKIAGLIPSWSPSHQYDSLRMVKQGRSNSEWLPIARILAPLAMTNAGTNPEGPSVAAASVLTAARVLVKSETASDLALARDCVFVFPRQERLWLSLSNLQARDDVIALAEKVFSESVSDPAMRGATGLVLVKAGRPLGDVVVDQVLIYLNDFGCLACDKWLSERNPEVFKWHDRGMVLLAVLDQLPGEIVLNNFDKFATLRHHGAGLTTLQILADRFPSRVLEAFESGGSSSAETYATLVGIALKYPHLASRAKNLVPAAEFEQLRTAIMDDGRGPFALAQRNRM